MAALRTQTIQKAARLATSCPRPRSIFLPSTQSCPAAASSGIAPFLTSSRFFSCSTLMSSPLPKVVLTRKLPSSLLPEAAERGEIDLVAWPHTDKAADRQWLLENIKGAAGVVVMLSDKVDEELINAAGSSLKAVSTMSVGYDHIALPLLKEKGVRLGYTPKVLNEAVSDLTTLLILGCTRELPKGNQIVMAGKWGQTPWSPLAFSGPSLKDKTIGFLGFGSIAQTTAQALANFSPSKIIYKASRPRPFDLSDGYFSELKAGCWEESQQLRKKQGKNAVDIENVDDVDSLAAQSDVLIVLASMSPKTKHIIGKDFLSKMKSTAYVINVARGPLIDTPALVEALKTGQIAGAGLDVLEGEPNVPSDHPLIADPEVRSKVLLMPHVGSANRETREEMSLMTESSVLGGIGLKGRKGKGEMEYELDF